MTGDWRPWQRTAVIWGPAVALCLLSGVVYAWQTSGSVGRRAQVRERISELEGEVKRLTRVLEQAQAERDAVGELDGQFTYLYDDVFGDLDERLTRILREVGRATREAGLQPGSFGYAASEDNRLDHVRFSIQFAVEGEYPQIRQLLAALQASPEFLIVEHIGIAGEEGATTRTLRISLRLATIFAKADDEILRRLTGGIRQSELANDGEDAIQG